MHYFFIISIINSKELRFKYITNIRYISVKKNMSKICEQPAITYTQFVIGIISTKNLPLLSAKKLQNIKNARKKYCSRRYSRI